ncbi:MAG TPA: hypothetical protein VL485_33505 [Ktedonobacteraceae bacterium]|jgi:hypothetical protein|nr:hypothetical protein [Ktedonobacteraceae bacterium]
MIDPTAIQKELDELAETLSGHGDVISASRIRQLMIALGGDPTAEDWAATNLQQIIDPGPIAEAIKSRSTPGRSISFLEWLRNGLVLVPLMITWLGISQASEKYQQLVTIDRNQELHSFLYLWQEGFNHTLPNIFILNNLAFGDAILLAVIFILTLATTWRQNLITTQHEKYAELLRMRLSHALGDAALCLAQIRRQQQARQPNNLNDISRYLFQFGENFKQTTEQFIHELEAERKNRGDLTTFTTTLSKMSQDMLAAATSIQQTNTNLTTTLQEILVPVKEIPALVVAATQGLAELKAMTTSLGQLVADQNKWRQELQTVLANGLNQLLTEQQQANQAQHTLLNSALQQLQTTLDQHTTNQQRATQDLRTMLSTLFTQQINEQTRIGGELHSLIHTSFNQLLAEQQKLGVSLLDAASELETGTNALNRVVQVLGKAAAEQTQLLNSMQSLQGEQRKLTSEMAAATAEIRNVLKSVREAGPELRSMAVDVDRFVQALRALPNALKGDMLAPIQHYSSAAAGVNAGANTLEKVALHLESVTTKLDHRLGP